MDDDRPDPDSTFEELVRIREAIEHGTALLADLLTSILTALSPTPTAATAVWTLGDPTVPITVDSTNAVAVLAFTDDHNDPVPAPDGTIAVATSDNTAVLEVGAAQATADAAGNATISFPLTEVSAGTANLSVTTTDANGNPLYGPDGVTPIPTPAPVAVTVNPGAAADEVFTVPGA